MKLQEAHRMQKVKKFGLNTNLQYSLATLGVIVATVLIDTLFTSKHTSVIETQIASAPAKEQTPKLVLPPMAKAISLAQNVTLPPVPKRNNSANLQTSEKKPLTIQKEELTETSYKHHNARSQQIEYATKSQELQSIDHHLNTMSSLSAEQLTLRFPISSRATQNILQYMHKCVGIDVGAIKDNSLMRLSHKVSHESQILRLVSGQKTQKEIALINAYAKGQAMVRIYPHSFDNTFATHVFKTIGSASLTQLSGEYQLLGQKLSLTNISVNQFPIENDWLLANIQICRA